MTYVLIINFHCTNFQVVLGVGYRFYSELSRLVGHKTVSCWTINRGQGLSPVQSCEGVVSLVFDLERGEKLFINIKLDIYINILDLASLD